jgi:hypothetical protein
MRANAREMRVLPRARRDPQRIGQSANLRLRKSFRHGTKPIRLG